MPFVHSFLRDILSSLVGAILSWVAQTVLSLGTLIPWVCGQIATRIASVVGKCSRYITALTTSGTKLASLLRALKGFGDDILQLPQQDHPEPQPLHPAARRPAVGAGARRPVATPARLDARPTRSTPTPRGTTPPTSRATCRGATPPSTRRTQAGQNATPDPDDD